MAQEELDRTSGYVNQLSNAMHTLAGQITAQGIGVSEKLDHASFRLKETLSDATARISDAVKNASEASDRHARGLVQATWLLVFATVALVAVTGIHAYVAATPFIYGYGAGSSAGTAFTLYRSSTIQENIRVHVATFDADDKEEYNRNNCEIAQGLFASQFGVKVKYWCEKGRHRK